MIKPRALYGIKSCGTTWRGKLEENLISLGYKSSEADADVWMKQDFKPNGDSYYKLMQCYVYDLLHIFFNPKD